MIHVRGYVFRSSVEETKLYQCEMVKLKVQLLATIRFQFSIMVVILVLVLVVVGLNSKDDVVCSCQRQVKMSGERIVVER